MFTDKQKRRFETTMDALFAFANISSGLNIPIELPVSTSIDALYGTRIGFELWDNIRLVDLFIEHAAATNLDVDLGAARQWRHALRGPFYVSECSGYVAELLYDETVFEVVSYERTWDDVIPYTPDVVYTTLVPYEGVITSDRFLLHHRSNAEGPGVEREEHALKRAKKHGVIRSASEFIKAADACNDRRRHSIMEPNRAMIWMDYVEQINMLCQGACGAYEFPVREVPPEVVPYLEHVRACYQ